MAANNIKKMTITLNLDDENDKMLYDFIQNGSGKSFSFFVKTIMYAVAIKYKDYDFSNHYKVMALADIVSNLISNNLKTPKAKQPINNKSLPKPKPQSVDSADEYAKYRGFGFTDEQLELIKQIDERHVRNGEGADAWVGDIESVKNDYGKYREYAKSHGFEFTAKQLRFAKSQDDDYIKQGKGPDYWEKDVDVIREM